VCGSLFILSLAFLSGCMANQSPSLRNQEGLNSSDSISSVGPVNTLTTGSESPQSSATFKSFAKAKISLDSSGLVTPKMQHDQGLLEIYGATSTEDRPILISWGKDGRILGRFIGGDSGKDRGDSPSVKTYLLGRVKPSITATAFSAASGMVAGVEEEGVVIKSLSGSQPDLRLSRLGTRIMTLEFSPAGDSILIGGADSMVYLWMFKDEQLNLEKMRPEWYLQRYPGLGSGVTALKFHPSGKFFMAADMRGTVSAWQRYGLDEMRGRYDTNISGKKFLTSITARSAVRPGGGDSIDMIQLDPTAQYMALALQDGKIEIWRLKGTVFQSVIKAHDGEIYSLDFLADDKLISLGKDGYVRSWKLTDLAEVHVLGKDSILGPEGQEVKVVKKSIARIKEVYLSNLVTGAVVPGEGYFAGDRTGRIVSVSLKED
jgi:WD40 repeat protein